MLTGKRKVPWSFRVAKFSQYRYSHSSLESWSLMSVCFSGNQTSMTTCLQVQFHVPPTHQRMERLRLPSEQRLIQSKFASTDPRTGPTLYPTYCQLPLSSARLDNDIPQILLSLAYSLLQVQLRSASQCLCAQSLVFWLHLR